MTNTALLRWCAFTLLASCLVLRPTVLSAADTNVPDQPAPATRAQDLSSALLAALPQVPEIRLQGGAVVWHGATADQKILGLDDTTHDPLLDTPAGPLRAARRIFENHRVSVLTVLPALLANLKSANLPIKDFQLDEGVLTGPSLRSPTAMIVAEGLLTKKDTPDADRSADITQLSTAVAALLKAADTSKLDGIGRTALEDVIKKLDHPDGDEAPDELSPSFARRVVRHGWLHTWFSDGPNAALAGAVEKAIAAAEDMKPIKEFSGDGLRLAQLNDAFQQGGWVFSTPKHVIFERPEVHPEYLGEIAELLVIAELPAGSDPVTDAAKVISARTLHGSTELASWSEAGGFSADPKLWRSMVPISSQDLVPDAIPPHILIAGLSGEVGGLAVAKGLLRPVQDHTHASAERFLNDAAGMLPDAASLDLVGEYLFSYVYPSPDAKHPELMGNRQQKGNVQQTVWQSCSNAAGGVMHGDCADIAEVYWELTSRQGRNPIIIGLPEHAACAWAEHTGPMWTVSILQTGPPLQFNDPVLPKCLEKAYKSFDPGMVFDANQLPLLLRFSGEVSRSEWALSWRIFSEPKYAKTMIDVQRDWHYETYQRGIATMKGLIAGGDDDNANYRELSGLYSFTGQYDLAADYHRKAMARVDNAINKLNMSVELIGHLLNAGKKEEAQAAATDVLTVQLPELKDRLGASYLQLGIELASTCLNLDGGAALRTTAEKTLKDVLSQPMGEYEDKVSGWLASDEFSADTWDNSPELRSLRTMMEEYTNVISSLVLALGHDRIPGDADLNLLISQAQKWFDGIAFHDVEENSSVLDRYAEVGSWYRAIQGAAAFDPLVDAASPATDPKLDHTKRVGGAAQVAKDLPWIRASVPYWFTRMALLFRKDQTTIDAKEVAHLAMRLDEAHKATEALGLSSPRFEQETLLGDEIAALIAHDLPALHAILTRVATQNDKDLRDDAAQWLGDSARFLDTAWYAQVLDAWKSDVDYKPKYFWIAWRAALNDAPEQALMAGKMAAERFPDDPAFTEEYAVMKQLLTPKIHAATAAPATAVPAGTP